MPGIFRRSVDLTVEEIKELYARYSCGKHLCKVSENLKDNTGRSLDLEA
jgi:porphobilinogen synthase